MNQICSEQLVGAVAMEFSQCLLNHVGAETLAEIVRQNAKETVDVCHSHDYCDANMVMEEAMKKHGLLTGEMSPEEREIWNKAWDLALSNGFAVYTQLGGTER